MQRRATKNTRGPNADEKAFHAWCKDCHCVVSKQTGVSVHHMYGSAFKHNKVLIGHWAVIPLSYEYHQGENGYHTIGQKLWCFKYGNQATHWKDLIKAYELYMGEPSVPNDVYNAIMDWGR